MKKMSMKYFNKTGIVLTAGFVLAAASCSDFSDYNDAVSESTMASSNLSLWENITQNQEQLSDFAMLVEKAGFVNELSTPRSLTIWAPVNGSFQMSDYENLTQEQLLQRFVRAHVAEYNHAATGEVDERVHMLNNKSMVFKGNGTYTFDDIAVSQVNIPSNNGLLHLIEKPVTYYPNVHDFLVEDTVLTAIHDYFMNYQDTVLNERSSIPGPRVNGEETYVYKVYDINNTLADWLRARLNNEDSTYTIVLPTNKAFQDMYDKIAPAYNFIEKTVVKDPEKFSNANGTDTKTVYTTNAAGEKISPEVLSDSLTKRAIVRHIVYSNNDLYNQWLVGKGEYLDTIRSTWRGRFSNPMEIMEDYMVGEPIKMSNGYGRIVDSLAFRSWESYLPEITVSPRRNLVNLFPDAAKSQSQKIPADSVASIFGPDAEYADYSYAWIEPGGARNLPTVFLSLPNVMSTTYNFYVVFLPTANPLISRDGRPNWLNFQLEYGNAAGATSTYCFSKAVADAIQAGGDIPKAPTTVGKTTAFVNDPEKTDTVFIGQFTFPIAYNGLPDNTYPSLKITMPISVFNQKELATYSRDLRIAAIIMRPVELDEYLKNNK